ncbi:MAG: glycosyltransferase [Thermoplasmata archaeon]|nr:glycosyltransferase [Thermoplasmata archaeon]
MLISVVITVRNEEKHIGDLLDSLLVQEPPFEVLIVDSSSEDRTCEIVREYMKNHNNIRLLEHGGTRGESRNLGVKHAKGEYVAFTDGDCITNPFWLSELRKGLKEAQIVAGKTIQIGYHAFEKLERVELMYKGMDVTYPTANIAYEKRLFEKIGGFDPWFVTAEDIDLNLRAVDIGAKIIYNPRAIIYHRARESFYKFFKQAFWNGYGRKQLTLKHGKLWQNYKPTEMLKASINFWYLARLAFAFLGYIACKFFGKPRKV